MGARFWEKALDSNGVLFRAASSASLTSETSAGGHVLRPSAGSLEGAKSLALAKGKPKGLFISPDTRSSCDSFLFTFYRRHVRRRPPAAQFSLAQVDDGDKHDVTATTLAALAGSGVRSTSPAGHNYTEASLGPAPANATKIAGGEGRPVDSAHAPCLTP